MKMKEVNAASEANFRDLLFFYLSSILHLHFILLSHLEFDEFE